MIAVNYSQARKNLKVYFDKASQDYETIVVTRKNGQNVVVLSEESFNNLLENAYLTSSKANFDWLMESKKQYESGLLKAQKLLEDDAK